jgi:hypothetical protein
MPGRFGTRKRYDRSCQATVSTTVAVEHREHRLTGKSSITPSPSWFSVVLARVLVLSKPYMYRVSSNDITFIGMGIFTGDYTLNEGLKHRKCELTKFHNPLVHFFFCHYNTVASRRHPVHTMGPSTSTCWTTCVNAYDAHVFNNLYDNYYVIMIIWSSSLSLLTSNVITHECRNSYFMGCMQSITDLYSHITFA